MKMRRLLLWIGVLAALLLVSGCVSTTDGNGNLPWSAPASWEDQTLGVPL
jgi:predicted small secreted protein